MQLRKLFFCEKQKWQFLPLRLLPPCSKSFDMSKWAECAKIYLLQYCGSSRSKGALVIVVLISLKAIAKPFAPQTTPATRCPWPAPRRSASGSSSAWGRPGSRSRPGTPRETRRSASSTSGSEVPTYYKRGKRVRSGFLLLKLGVEEWKIQREQTRSFYFSSPPPVGSHNAFQSADSGFWCPCNNAAISTGCSSSTVEQKRKLVIKVTF